MNMRSITVPLMISALGIPSLALGQTEAPPAWVEYEVSGDWTASGREDDVVLCTDTGEQFLARSLGEVIIDLEADGRGDGVHEASVYVATGDGPRSEGRGTVTIRDTGEESFGMSILTVEFEASGLVSTDGVRLAVRGQLACTAM